MKTDWTDEELKELGLPSKAEVHELWEKCGEDEEREPSVSPEKIQEGLAELRRWIRLYLWGPHVFGAFLTLVVVALLFTCSCYASPLVGDVAEYQLVPGGFRGHRPPYHPLDMDRGGYVLHLEVDHFVRDRVFREASRLKAEVVANGKVIASVYSPVSPAPRDRVMWTIFVPRESLADGPQQIVLYGVMVDDREETIPNATYYISVEKIKPYRHNGDHR